MNCRSCGKEIVFMKTASGKTIPVDLDSIKDMNGGIFNIKKHVAHFATCPDAAKFRRDKK